MRNCVHIIYIYIGVPSKQGKSVKVAKKKIGSVETGKADWKQTGKKKKTEY